MKTLTRTSGAILTLAAAVALAPSGVDAQEPVMPGAGQECTAQVSPSQVQAGQEAVQVTVTLSENLGMVTDVTQEGGQGISLAEPTDIPRTEMAAGEQPSSPIEMGANESTWTLWLNTAEAEEGTQSLQLHAGEGGQNHCSAEIEIVAPAG